MAQSNDDPSNSSDLEKRIEELESEISFLKDDLDAADEEVEKLEQRIRELEGSPSLQLTLIQVIERIKTILSRAKHNVSITVPHLPDLECLNLFDIPSHVQIKCSAAFEAGNPDHIRTLNEHTSFDHIQIRDFANMDRWSILRDGEEIFFSVIGTNPDKMLAFQTDEPKAIGIFNGVAMESWLVGKKIEK